RELGKLNIWIKEGVDLTLLWSLDGEQGNEWRDGQVSYYSSNSHEIIIEGIRGSGFKGDISIDDITFTSGRCPTSPLDALPENATDIPVVTTQLMTTPMSVSPYDCNFEDGFCMWKVETKK
ncbi:unnamed protein product, partial [Owenia fusiformis]